MNDNSNPLVSVIVVTYNSSDFIVETLESVKAQTYSNIELIISDDHSTDETIELASEWVAINKARFVRTEIISVDYNTGVTANYNRAVKACRGIWVKNVDGDDLLHEDCITDNVNYVNAFPDAKLVFSNVVHFRGSNPKVMIREHFDEDGKSFFKLDAEGQFKRLLYSNVLPSQSCFVTLDLLRKYPYNEKYRGLEDEPMWINLTRHGYKAYFLDKITAYYRKAESTTASSTRYFSPVYVESFFMFFWGEKVKFIKDLNLIDAYNKHRRTLLLMEFADIFLKNRRTRLHNLLYKIFYDWILKRITFVM